MHLDKLDDHTLFQRSRETDPSRRAQALQALYSRYYDRVSLWAPRSTGREEEDAELAQEVFTRVHQRIDGFRLDCAFSTWIYRITRNLAIDRARGHLRKGEQPLDDAPEPVDPRLSTDERLRRQEVVDRSKDACGRDLDPVELRALYLHYIDGASLAEVTDTLKLDNASGAKAYLVSARRKLARHFGRWLDNYRHDDLRSTP